MPRTPSAPLAVVAIGGHAFIEKGEEGTIQDHERNAEKVSETLVTLVRKGYRLVLTHGNGPQVGSLLTQQERSGDEVPPMPLDVLVAMTEGSLGYILQQSLLNRLHEAGLPRRVVTMVTQVVVDPADPAFDEPSKPIGPVLSEASAQRRAEEFGWEVKQVGEDRWRRVVPSPRPLEVLQYEMVRDVAADEHIVIAGGGGGIPVVRESNGRYAGVEGVVDKDLTSSVLASHINASLLVILTAVPCVYRDFGKPSETPLGAVTLEEMERLRDDGQFPPGSMGPKADAVIGFLQEGGGRALVTDANSLTRAIEGRAGTHVVGRL
jgi:carbamate kinase